ncbi:MAG: hypothetical protein ACYC56_03600 [Candidatus Aquicultor sp.]
METTATFITTTTVSLVATANAVATTTSASQDPAITDWVTMFANILLVLFAVIGGLFAYYRYRISVINRLVEVLDEEGHYVQLWNLSLAIRGGSGDKEVFYDPGSRTLSPRAWHASMADNAWTINSPNLKQTSVTLSEPYYSLFAAGFGPGHSTDGKRADFMRFKSLVRQLAVASGFGSKWPIEALLRRHLARYLLLLTDSRLTETFLHFEVVVSRLISFRERPDLTPSVCEIDRNYFWESYGLDAQIYQNFRRYLLKRTWPENRTAVEAWIDSSHREVGFSPVSLSDYKLWTSAYKELDKRTPRN